jgi:hypothetical protein
MTLLGLPWPLHLRLAGVALVGLALVHVIFPRYFRWKTDLQPLSLINREMMVVHTFFVAFVVLLMGVLCLLEPVALVETPLGRRVCAGLALFWGARLLVQHLGYSSSLWRGKRFETAVHGVFTVLWSWLTLVFAVGAWGP